MTNDNNLYTVASPLYGVIFLAKQDEERSNAITAHHIHSIHLGSGPGACCLDRPSWFRILAVDLPKSKSDSQAGPHASGDASTMHPLHRRERHSVSIVWPSRLPPLLRGISVKNRRLTSSRATCSHGRESIYYRMGGTPMTTTTFPLPIDGDGVVAPTAGVVDVAVSANHDAEYFCLREKHRTATTATKSRITDSGGDILVAEAGMCAAWVISFVSSLLVYYMVAVLDGRPASYGWIAAYLTVIVLFVTSLFVLLVIKNASTLVRSTTQNGVEDMAQRLQARPTRFDGELRVVIEDSTNE